ncbi:secreted protein [Candidatus Thiomargarita nelsonii]|uniref:Secreted protein n=1 Tax=Candidatus Thiomargarita nelsonii TaxID=1003181 RepID=A0A176S431_9GAMM|nr:secreted protein [Candidatus Thiomargarita nelsonii]
MKYRTLFFVFIALFPYSSYAEQENLVELLSGNGCNTYQSGYRPEQCSDSSSYTILSEADIAIYFSISYTNQRDYRQKWEYFRISPGCKWRFYCGEHSAHVSYDQYYYTPGVQNKTRMIAPGKEYKFVFNAKGGELDLVENPK